MKIMDGRTSGSILYSTCRRLHIHDCFYGIDSTPYMYLESVVRSVACSHAYVYGSIRSRASSARAPIKIEATLSNFCRQKSTYNS